MASGIRNNKFGKFRRDLHEEARRRLARAAIVVERRAKERLSVPGTGVVRGGSVVPKVKGMRGRTAYGAFPSRPGESPHKQTGRLRGSVTWELVATGLSWAARVGTNVLYGRVWEVGRRGVKRPWLVVSLNESMAQVRAILAAPWRWPG